jgi:hypothetical protein
VPETICPCIVAKQGLFQERERHQIASLGLKWQFLENGLSLFEETLSYDPEKQVIRG